MPLRNVATTFTIEQQRLEINALAGDVNNIATGVTSVGTAATANALATGATGEDLTLSGTLTVNGTQTILNTATLEVEDKNIVIAKGSTTDAAASGGGITLKGANDKTILYNQTGDQWEFNKSVTVAGNIQFTQGTPELEFNNGGARLTVQAANSLSVHTGGGIGTTTNEVARFTNTGLGIGIDAPTRKLDVRESGANDVATFINSDTTNGYGINVKGGGTAANRYALRVANGADTECFKVNANGFAYFTGSNDLRVTLGNVGTAGTNDSNWLRASDANLMYNAASGYHLWEIGGAEAGRLTSTGFELGEGKKTIFGSNSGNGGYIKHQSGHLEIKNETGNCYWDNIGGIRIRTGANYDTAININTDQSTTFEKIQIQTNSNTPILEFQGASNNQVGKIDSDALSPTTSQMRFYIEEGGNLAEKAAIKSDGVYDIKGNLRRIPRKEPTSGTSYTLVADDSGRVITHGATIVMAANGTFTHGDAITIYNYSASAITIDASTNSALLHWTDGTTAATGDRQLASRGVATLLCVEGTNNTWVITGSLT